MAEREASGALHNNGSTPKPNGVAPGGLPLADQATPATPHQWNLQCLIAAIRNLNRDKPSRQNQ
jgi:hypothetical protein